ncbi:MAG: hypothetical protein ACR2NU_02445 [Aeoliella sp.]
MSLTRDDGNLSNWCVICGFRVASTPEPKTLPGDFCNSGSVDAADYTVWRNTLGQTGTSLAADGTGSSDMPDGLSMPWTTISGMPILVRWFCRVAARSRALPFPNQRLRYW